MYSGINCLPPEWIFKYSVIIIGEMNSFCETFFFGNVITFDHCRSVNVAKFFIYQLQFDDVKNLDMLLNVYVIIMNIVVGPHSRPSKQLVQTYLKTFWNCSRKFKITRKFFLTLLLYILVGTWSNSITIAIRDFKYFCFIQVPVYFALLLFDK